MEWLQSSSDGSFDEDSCSIQVAGNGSHFIYEGYLYGGIPENLTINAIVWAVSYCPWTWPEYTILSVLLIGCCFFVI